MKNLPFILAILVACTACNPFRGTTSKSGITEKYWKLISVGGAAVQPPAEGAREAHIILKKADSRVTGSGGCNLINGTYELKGRSRIAFSQMLSTKMACPGMDTETRFLQALAETDRYVIIGETLTLYDDGKVVAVLQAVYLR